MIQFKSIEYKNFLSVGNAPIRLSLDTHPLTLITGKNGAGKCLDKTTKIDIHISDKEVEKIFLEFMKNR